MPPLASYVREPMRLATTFVHAVNLTRSYLERISRMAPSNVVIPSGKYAPRNRKFFLSAIRYF